MFDSLLNDQANVTLAGVPDGAESYALARLLAESSADGLALGLRGARRDPDGDGW